MGDTGSGQRDRGDSGPRFRLPFSDDLLVSDVGELEELEAEATELADPDDPGPLVVPHGLVRRLLADPQNAPAILAANSVQAHAARADREVRLLRERNPDATDRQLALHFKQKFSRLARWEGAATGVGGLLTLPADLVALAWVQNRMILTIAASYGHEMQDERERATELLLIQGAFVGKEPARKSLVAASKKNLTKLALKHLRKDTLTLVKKLFSMVGIKFTRKALIEKGIPLVAIPISAGLNEAATRLMANRAVKYYDTTIK